MGVHNPESHDRQVLIPDRGYRNSLDATPLPSFPRKRESICFQTPTRSKWIPAVAGMTAVGGLRRRSPI